MNIYLIAEKLSHSYSPIIHNKFKMYDYSLKELPRDELGNFMQNKNFDGLNVTIPYKIDVIPYLDSLSTEAKEIGSVNTITNKDGFLKGYNTDLYGFLYLVNKNNIDFTNKKVLILGNGGASKTVQTAMKTLKVKEFKTIGRKENTHENLSKYHDYDIIVNTTPVGMYPSTGISPVDLNLFTNCKAVVDLIYNPSKTHFLIDAEKKGIKAVNGLSMLVAQAKKACEIFTDKPIPDSVIDTITAEIEFDAKNIVLIGMPGCGKSTIGKIIAEKLNREYIDTDEEITKSGVNISEMIMKQGELKFRETEHLIAKEILNKSNKVISTGGGIVTYTPNEDLLKQNSYICFINRNIDKLATNGRPLSTGGIEALKNLYNKRISLYKNLCDFEVDNNSDIDTTVDKILDKIRKEEI